MQPDASSENVQIKIKNLSSKIMMLAFMLHL